MCNICNTGFNYGCNGFWGGTQRLCRDCNGNIVVNQRNTNTCGHCCGCCHQHTCNCGCGNNTGAAGNGNGNGNGGKFVCYTVCGYVTATGTNTTNMTNTANTTYGDLYYARQYGLYPYGYNRGCGCTLDALGTT